VSRSPWSEAGHFRTTIGHKVFSGAWSCWWGEEFVCLLSLSLLIACLCCVALGSLASSLLLPHLLRWLVCWCRGDILLQVYAVA
jgi:uncharacterized membrane protein YfcA